MQRLAYITNVFARHGLWSAMETMGIRSWLTPEQVKQAEEISRASRDGEPPATELHPQAAAGGHGPTLANVVPGRLRAAFEELGPAFVKLGQVLATREDLLPPAFTQELSKLHAGVQTLPFSAVRQVLADELGEVVLEQFQQIDERPLAAGSMAQVHRATLRDGTQVVLKIQRPDIAQKIETDLSLMETIAALLERYFPETRILRPTVAIEEFARGTLGELDFIREAGTMAKIATNFAGVAYVKIPSVHWELTTSRVLTITYLDGVTINDREELKRRNFDPMQLVERGLSAFMQMVFVDGFFHGDLHPGNLLALEGSNVGILDFGVSVRIGRAVRERLAGLLLALVDEDYEAMANHFVELSNPSGDFDMDAFVHDVSNAMAPFVGLNLGDTRSGHLLWDFARIAARHGAPMPRELILFLRTFVAFEGIGTQLDPSFDVIATCRKFTARLVEDMYSTENLKRQGLVIARDFAALARTAPRQLRALLKSAIEGDLRLTIASEEMDRLASALDRSSSRMTVGMVVAALIIGSAILVPVRGGGEVYHMSVFGVVGFTLAGVGGLYVMWSIFRGRGGF